MNTESKRRARAARPEIRAEVHFLEQVRIRLPGDVEVARALADLYTRVGRFEDGRTLDLDIVRLRPDDALAWYNLACSHALCDQVQDAVRALEQAVARGYGDAEWMLEDEDLASLQPLEDFRRIVALARGG